MCGFILEISTLLMVKSPTQLLPTTRTVTCPGHRRLGAAGCRICDLTINSVEISEKNQTLHHIRRMRACFSKIKENH